MQYRFAIGNGRHNFASFWSSEIGNGRQQQFSPEFVCAQDIVHVTNRYGGPDGHSRPVTRQFKHRITETPPR